MARQTFAGDLAAFTATVQTVGTQTDILQLARNVTGITVWDALTGGTQITDLTDLGGGAITTVSSDGNGLFVFKGPNTVPETLEVWVDAGFGSRQYVSARLAAKLQAVEAVAGGAVPAALVNAKGDLLAATADDTVTRLGVGANGLVLTADATTATGLKWAPSNREFVFSLGVVATGAGTFRWYNNSGAALTISAVRTSVGTAPVGSTLIVDVNVNGTTIYGTQSARPTIAAGAFTAVGGTPTVTTVPAGAYVTVDVDQVGSTTPGANLGVQIELTA